MNEGDLFWTMTPQRRQRQFRNASGSTVVTLRGMFTVLRLTQSWNADDLIVVTLLSGIRTISRFVHPMKEDWLIVLTLSEIAKNLFGDAGGYTYMYDLSLEYIAPLSLTKCEDSKLLTDLKEMHPWKTPKPSVLREELLVIVRLISLMQFMKQCCSIVSMLSGTTKDVIDVLLSADIPSVTTFDGNVKEDKPTQFIKKNDGILSDGATLLSNSILVSPEFEKHPAPISITLLGIFIEVNEVQSEKT